MPVGIGPRRCSKGRDCGPPGPLGPPPDRGVNVRPCPGCCGRIGCPGRGPGRDSLDASGRGPRLPVGIGPRFPDGNGRDGAPVLAGAPGGRPVAEPGAEAAGRIAEGCAPPGAVGRIGVVGRMGATGRAPAGAGGAPAGASGRIGVGAGVAGVVVAGAIVTGAAGFAAGGAATAGSAGAGTLGAAGAAAAGASGTTVFAAGTAGTAGATGFTATGATLTGGGAATAAGLVRAAFAAASFASFSALAAASAFASSSAAPRIFLRTFTATSSGIELECVFFSVTPYPGNRSMMAFALTSSSRASSLIRT